MKKSISALLMLAFLTATYGQERTITIPEITKENYLKKSKKQKTTAWIFLGTGSLATVLGAIEVNPDYGESTNSAFLFIGGLVMIGASVTLFNASARNKKRGMSMSFKNNVVPQLRNNNFSYSSVPSISLKIGL
jgi:hypothetical protein